MIELSNTNKQYQEIKDELVLEIAEIDMKLEETQEKIRVYGTSWGGSASPATADAQSTKERSLISIK